jgi:hypothetical protein
MRLLVLMAFMLVACFNDEKKSQATDKAACADQRQCVEQAPLCFNSCDVPGASSTCAECCAEQRKICENCEGFFPSILADDNHAIPVHSIVPALSSYRSCCMWASFFAGLASPQRSTAACERVSCVAE